MTDFKFFDDVDIEDLKNLLAKAPRGRDPRVPAWRAQVGIVRLRGSKKAGSNRAALDAEWTQLKVAARERLKMQKLTQDMSCQVKGRNTA